MSSYWDNVEKEKRRQRWRGWVRLVTSVLFLLVFLGWMSSRSINVLGPAEPKESGSSATPENQTESPLGTNASAPADKPMYDSGRLKADRLPPIPDRIVAAASTPEPPSRPTSAKRKPEQTKQGKHDLQTLQGTIGELEPQAAIEACRRFRDQYPDLATRDVLAELVAQIDATRWLELAAQEADKVSPASGAFGAVWLPIAETWEYQGNPAEAREAMRRARASAPRMLSTGQQYAWLVDLYRDGLLTPDEAKSLLEDAIVRTSELSNKYDRRGMQAHLSGIATAMGQQAIASRLWTQVNDREPQLKIRERIDDYVFFKWRAWAASWHDSPQTIESTAQQLERLNYRRMPLIGNAYAHAAMAAARDRDEAQFYRMALRAEAAFSQTDVRSDQTYPHAYRLAEAYLQMGEWRHALVVGNNLTDPNLTASVNFRVLASAPQDVDANDARQLIADHGDDRYAPRGVASYVEHRLRNGEDPIELAEWTSGLESPALRASGYAGFARVGPSLVAPVQSMGDRTACIQTKPRHTAIAAGRSRAPSGLAQRPVRPSRGIHPDRTGLEPHRP